VDERERERERERQRETERDRDREREYRASGIWKIVVHLKPDNQLLVFANLMVYNSYKHLWLKTYTQT
jgi:hypothetical protein